MPATAGAMQGANEASSIVIRGVCTSRIDLQVGTSSYIIDGSSYDAPMV